MTTITLTIKRKRDASLKRRHPWVFSGAIDGVSVRPGIGETVDLRGHDGRWLGRGAYSPNSKISARVWTFEDEPIDEAWFRARIERAVRARASLFADPEQNACRLVFGESDGLPGLIADRYGDWVVCQFLSAGADEWRETIARALLDLTGALGVYERSDSGVRRLEGLPERTGTMLGEDPPDRIEIREGAVRYWVDVRKGHKTGYYLDQRDARARVGLACEGADVLNCFSYTGGFGLAAALGGAASVTDVESSAHAIETARANAELNGLDEARFERVEGDVFKVLRTMRDAGRTFDVIVLDPPKFAESRSQVERASRAYKDINLYGFKLLKPGGTLFTFSCSGHIKPDLFQKIVAGAALDARRDARIVGTLGQPLDHPISLHFPESSYLKGLEIQAL